MPSPAFGGGVRLIRASSQVETSKPRAPSTVRARASRSKGSGPNFVQQGTKRFDDESVEPNDRIGQSILRPTGVKDIFVTMHETGVEERGQRVCETLPASLQPGRPSRLASRRQKRSREAVSRREIGQ